MRLPVAVNLTAPEADVRLAAFSVEAAGALFVALDHADVWAHIPGPRPASPTDLATLLTGDETRRQALVIHARGRVAGTSSYFFDHGAPEGVEIGATLYAPALWGSGVNTAVKGSMISAAFAAGAQWVQFRTDERNGRSAAAILKLPGAVELPPLLESEKIRSDGTVRTSRMFRIPRPAT
ncbi:Protein N-acetyltransferase, RimJ/RimL family [Tsukamurella pulmonis]|uniref:Protein N-acetyltransferase, RimJ/RimL family n=1 Tax=Tsukamurella pulmonis TaxID=47312 RepID=A0A1H1HCR4_9ACTN|nr:GNAT family protein [Tsukamurella pulmonis]SDR22816.1 Protein N-acetyltransferase, RimJ/RimL family [Tsukamurella pulmonis]SUP15301.1 Uncharacterised protein [Tsukamurella pulmonis]